MPILKKMIAQEQAGWLARAQTESPAGYVGGFGNDVPGLGNRDRQPLGVGSLMEQAGKKSKPQAGGGILTRPGDFKTPGGVPVTQHELPGLEGGVRPLPGGPGIVKPGPGGGVLPGPVGELPGGGVRPLPTGGGGDGGEVPVENPDEFVDPSQVSGEPVSGAAKRFETTSEIVQRISPNVRSRYSAPGRLRGLGGGGVRRRIRRGVETLPAGAKWFEQTDKFDRQRLLEAAVAGGQ